MSDRASGASRVNVITGMLGVDSFGLNVSHRDA
jgi:hypothetical protein